MVILTDLSSTIVHCLAWFHIMDPIVPQLVHFDTCKKHVYILYLEISTTKYGLERDADA